MPPAAATREVAPEGELEDNVQLLCTLRFHEQEAVSYPSEITAATVFEPTIDAEGAKAATLCVPLPETVKLEADAAPLSVQAKLRASELASLPLAVRLIEPDAPTTLPVAAGNCDEQVGGVFLTTVHV